MCRFFSNFTFVEKFILLKIGSTMDAYHPKRRFTLSFAGWKCESINILHEEVAYENKSSYRQYAAS